MQIVKAYRKCVKNKGYGSKITYFIMISDK